MKHLILLIILLVSFGCKKSTKKQITETEHSSVDFNTFPSGWQRLTLINDKPTLYFPCKGGDQSIQFIKLSNGDQLMKLNYKEDYFDYIVSELIKKENGYLLKTIDRKSYQPKVFNIDYYNKEKDMFYWSWEHNNQKTTFLYTPFKPDNKIPVVYQPCKECPNTPCVDKEIKKGKYQLTLPYSLALDGNDWRELTFSISKDSLSELKIYYYPEDGNKKGDSIYYTGKAKIDSTHIAVSFHNFDNQLLTFFNPLKEPELEYLNDSLFRFKKTVKGLTIDGSFCENWAMKKYKN